MLLDPLVLDIWAASFASMHWDRPERLAECRHLAVNLNGVVDTARGMAGFVRLKARIEAQGLQPACLLPPSTLVIVQPIHYFESTLYKLLRSPVY